MGYIFLYRSQKKIIYNKHELINRNNILLSSGKIYHGFNCRFLQMKIVNN